MFKFTNIQEHLYEPRVWHITHEHMISQVKLPHYIIHTQKMQNMVLGIA